MSISTVPTPAIAAVVAGLVTVESWQDASFISLPLIYPGGSFVTVKVDPLAGGRYRVSDGGFGFREIEAIGAQRSFARAATAIADESDIGRNAREFFIEIDGQRLSRAVMDVGTASWQLVDRIYARFTEGDEGGLVEHLTERLDALFGKDSVEVEATLVGASTAPWDVTAIVKREGRFIAFQAVSAYANSVYRANAAFDDLSALHNPPSLVAVVHSKPALGPRLALLARSAKIIEEDQPDAAFLRAAA